MILKNEKGFTLLEMILVLAIMVIFVASMTSLLITTTKVSSAVIKENEAKSIQSLLFPHMERSLRRYDQSNAFSIQAIDAYDPVLVIDTDPSIVNSIKLYYFYEPSDQSVYFQAGTMFHPNDKNSSIQVATRIEGLSLSLSSDRKQLRIRAQTKINGAVKEYQTMISLKAN